MGRFHYAWKGDSFWEERSVSRGGGITAKKDPAKPYKTPSPKTPASNSKNLTTATHKPHTLTLIQGLSNSSHCAPGVLCFLYKSGAGYPKYHKMALGPQVTPEPQALIPPPDQKKIEFGNRTPKIRTHQ